jgi:DNA-binding PucR family transcriptional regulator
VHHKTVAYRLNQAEELRDRSLSEDTFGLETALLIDQTLHGPTGRSPSASWPGK